jgi:predicted ATPase
MGFYNLNPDRVRDLQDPDPGDLLARDGRNMASVVRRLKEDNPKTYGRIMEYLRAVIPGVTSVEPRSLGPKETLEFRQEIAGDPNPWRFLASNMSDGTLRVFGVLVAVFQANSDGRYHAPLIGIEEPEVAIHPGAAAKLMDALLEAREQTQILVTTHSPDLLDHEGVDPDGILAVSAKGGETIITPVDQATRSVIRDRLYTVGELLRLGQIEPDVKLFQELTQQLDLFSKP